ncbi:unnamed protein product [Spodoptera exigua]|nr:unnamed protein product [Spodoptera exigua]
MYIFDFRVRFASVNAALTSTLNPAPRAIPATPPRLTTSLAVAVPALSAAGEFKPPSRLQAQLRNMARSAPRFTRSGAYFEGKERFLIRLQETDKQSEHFRTRAEIDLMITDIIDKKPQLSPYVVRKEDGIFKLLVKGNLEVNSSKVDVLVEVIADDDIYDYVMVEHLKNDHASANKIYEKFKLRYAISQYIIELVIEQCLKCAVSLASDSSEEFETPLRKGVGEWRISIINVGHLETISNPDDYEILCITDTETRFTILRPIMDHSKNCLYKNFDSIIMEYGFPVKIQVPEKLKFLRHLMDQIWSRRDSPKIRVAMEVRHDYDFAEDKERCEVALISWAAEADDKLLSIGCACVEYCLNVTRETFSNPDGTMTCTTPMTRFYRRKQAWDHEYS